MLKRIESIGMFLLLIIGMSQKIFAEEPVQTQAPPREVETGLEYLAPFTADRDIETISFDIFVPSHQQIANKSLVLYKGLTITRPWGTIDRTTIDPDSTSYGMGPIYLIRKQCWQQARWQLISDFSGGLILYSNNFPAGGDIYNFMWRLGPRIIYKMNDQISWCFGYTLMHVSNGQISNRMPTHNPSYNAGGFTVHMNIRF